VIFAEILNGI